jgi:hypothetical protein
MWSSYLATGMLLCPEYVTRTAETGNEFRITAISSDFYYYYYYYYYY